MKRNISLKLFYVLLLLWAGLAFTCNTGGKRGAPSRESDEPSQQRTRQTRTGIGAPYEARDPDTCADASEPASAQEVAENFRCNSEEVSGGKLHLVENIVISEMGNPRQYDHYHDMEAWGIDATQSITPIRGSFDLYVCDEVSDYMQNSGKNCLVFPEPDAVGLCYQTASGEWKCIMQDTTSRKTTSTKAPPR